MAKLTVVICESSCEGERKMCKGRTYQTKAHLKESNVAIKTLEILRRISDMMTLDIHVQRIVDMVNQIDRINVSS